MSWTRVRICTSPAPFLSVINFQLPPHLFLSTFFPSGFRGSLNRAADAPPTKSLVISKIQSKSLTFSARHHPAQSTVLLFFYIFLGRKYIHGFERLSHLWLLLCCCSFNLVLPSWHTLLCLIVKISFHYHLFFSVFGCFLGTHNNNNVFFFSLEQFKLFKVAPNLQTCQYWILNGRSQAVWVWRRLTMFSVGHRKIFHLHFLAPQTGGEEKRFNPSGFSPLCQFVQQCLITVSISLILSIFCCKEQTWQLLFDTFLVPK